MFVPDNPESPVTWEHFLDYQMNVDNRFTETIKMVKELRKQLDKNSDQFNSFYNVLNLNQTKLSSELSSFNSKLDVIQDAQDLLKQIRDSREDINSIKMAGELIRAEMEGLAAKRKANNAPYYVKILKFMASVIGVTAPLLVGVWVIVNFSLKHGKGYLDLKISEVKTLNQHQLDTLKMRIAVKNDSLCNAILGHTHQENN